MLERANKACLYCLNIYIFEQHGAKKGFLGEEKGFISLSGKKNIQSF